VIFGQIVASLGRFRLDSWKVISFIFRDKHVNHLLGIVGASWVEPSTHFIVGFILVRCTQLGRHMIRFLWSILIVFIQWSKGIAKRTKKGFKIPAKLPKFNRTNQLPQ
jgi:hypothetical protein